MTTSNPPKTADCTIDSSRVCHMYSNIEYSNAFWKCSNAIPDENNQYVDSIRFGTIKTETTENGKDYSWALQDVLYALLILCNIKSVSKLGQKQLRVLLMLIKAIHFEVSRDSYTNHP